MQTILNKINNTKGGQKKEKGKTVGKEGKNAQKKGNE